MSGIWPYVTKEHASTTRDERCRTALKGRVLRVKDGYNPNSSSVGSAIPLYLAWAAGSSVLAVLLLNLRSAVGSLVRKQKLEVARDPEGDDGAGPTER